MKKGEKASKQLTLSDLIAKVLKSNIRNDPTGGLFWVSAMGFIGCKLSRLELSVVEYRYNIERDYEDSSVARTAGVLNITEAKVRALEANAIKRLREPDCFSYFVKNFGSKELLCELLDHGQDELTTLLHSGRTRSPSEHELVELLDAQEVFLKIFRKCQFFQGTPPLTLTDLGLSTRALNALTWNKVITVEELCGTTEQKFKLFVRAGPVSSKEIKAALAKHGLSLAK